MYLFFDTETTGIPKNWKAPLSDFENWPRLVQLAFQLFDDEGILIKEGDYIIKPSGFNIPSESTAIHGITNEQAKSEGIRLSSVLDDFSSILENVQTIVAHNLSFDEKIIGCEYLRMGLPNPLVEKNRICTMESSTNYCEIDGPFGYKWPKLSELYFKIFDTELEETHNALVDIRATSKCFWQLMKIGVIRTSSSQIITEKEKPRLSPCYIDRDGDKKYGYWYSDTKKLAVPCIYDKTFPFNGNYAKVIWEGKTRYITNLGLLIEPAIYIFDEFRTGIIPASISARRYPLTDECMYGFIDVDLEELVIIPFIYHRVRDFSEGLAAVKLQKNWGFINKEGNEIIPIIYDFVEDFKSGQSISKKNGKFGIISRDNIELVPFIYDYIFSKPESGLLQLFQINGRSGFFNKESLKIEIEPIYTGANPYSDGLANVKYDSKWGFIDENGITKIPFIYDEARPFSEGLSNVKCNGKWGFIDREGNTIISFKYDDSSSFSDKLALVKFKGKWGLIDNNCKQVIPFIYCDAIRFGTEKIKVRKKPTLLMKIISILQFNFDGLKPKDYYIDKNGNEVN